MWTCYYIRQQTTTHSATCLTVLVKWITRRNTRQTCLNSLFWTQLRNGRRIASRGKGGHENLTKQSITETLIFNSQAIYVIIGRLRVRIVKNCDRGLENATRGGRPRAAFSSYFMLVAFGTPVKFSKLVFLMWNFVQSLKLYSAQELKKADDICSSETATAEEGSCSCHFETTFQSQPVILLSGFSQ